MDCGHFADDYGFDAGVDEGEGGEGGLEDIEVLAVVVLYLYYFEFVLTDDYVVLFGFVAVVHFSLVHS